MDSTALFAIFGSILLSAYFAGVEMAFVSSNKLKVELDKKQGFISGRIWSFFYGRESKFITTLLIGNNIGLVMFGVFFADMVEPPIEQYLTQNKILVLLTQTLISTVVVVLIAEFIPKAVFSIDPNRALRLVAIPTVLVYAVLWLPTVIITYISVLFLKLFRSGGKKKEIKFNRVDLDDYVKQGTQVNTSEEELENEVRIFKNALNFSKIKARDCMIPRTEMVAIDVEESIETLKEEFIKTHLSKILIYRDSIDNIIGYVHSYELYKSPENISSILLPISFAPESMPAQIILQEFIRQRRSIAVVVDEFGGTAGILTIEDIIEEIFGEIDDEHDVEEITEQKISETEYIFSGRAEIDHLNQTYNLHLPENDNYGTLAGFVLSLTADIPTKGDVIETELFRVTILQASGTRIEKVRLEIIGVE